MYQLEKIGDDPEQFIVRKVNDGTILCRLVCGYEDAKYVFQALLYLSADEENKKKKGTS
jgi:hypothetical protein